MNRKSGCAVLASLALASCAGAQIGVELRIVPRLGSTPITPSSEAILDFAVQARVTSTGNAYGLSSFSFNIRMPGEAEASGQLRRGGVTLADGTYDPALSTQNTTGRGGLARQYTYLAQLNSAFNGAINTTAGSFTNTPDQEIGLIAGGIGGDRLVVTPGVDDDGDGAPDSNPLPSSVMRTYFGAGQWTDVYRFRYFVNQLTGRDLSFQIEAISGIQVFSTVQQQAGQWTTLNTGATSVTATGVDFRMIPTPGMLALSMACITPLIARRRRV